MDRRAWQATVHRVAKNQTQTERLSTHAIYVLRVCFRGAQYNYWMNLLSPFYGWGSQVWVPLGLIWQSDLP